MKNFLLCIFFLASASCYALAGDKGAEKNTASDTTDCASVCKIGEIKILSDKEKAEYLACFMSGQCGNCRKDIVSHLCNPIAKNPTPSQEIFDMIKTTPKDIKG